MTALWQQPELFRTSAIRHNLAPAEDRNTEHIHEGICQSHASRNILDRPENQPCRGSWLGADDADQEEGKIVKRPDGKC